ncbi:MAG: alpha/beta hydrolase family protein [Cryomorphaceae bacterium]|nr:alpha/beta hydrolase [Flavobacteriales bacterium]
MKIGLHILALLLVASIQGIAQESKYQDPEPPFPYASEEVSYKNESDGISLAGTLTYPKEKGPHPAVILISGSGPQDRNSELLGHRPFLVISDYLTRNGIAVLRTDDRGAGESGGNHNASGLAEFTSDALAAVDYLKSRSEINSSKIGLIGHSLGGIIGPMTAAENSDIAYLILLAGPGMKGHELMLLQKEIIERQMGIDDLSIAIGQKNIGGAYDIILSAKMDSDSLNTQLEAYFKQIYGMALTEEQLSATAEQLSFPWFTDFVKSTPIAC